MKKYFGMLKDGICCLLIVGVIFGTGYYVGHRNHEPAVPVVEPDTTSFDLALPGEVEKRVVTVEEVESRLIEIGELSTYSGTYTITFGKDETRYWLEDIPIPGTTNGLTLTCDGIVKVGYSMNDLSVKVEDDKIFISIPAAELHDNYVIWDSILCTERNNILNPIEFSQYQDLIDTIEQMGLEDVKAKGIYQFAEENLKVLIEAFLAEFADYTIVYM